MRKKLLSRIVALGSLYAIAVSAIGQITTYPYTETFDSFPVDNTSFAPGAEPNAFPNNWDNLQADAATQDWYGRSTATGSSNTGPSSDHTSGSGVYVFVEDGFGNFSDVTLRSPELDLNATGTPFASVWVHSSTTSGTTNEMYVEVYSTMNNTWTRIDTIGNVANQWTQYTYDLSAYIGDTVSVGFVVDNSTTSFQHDIAIDDFSAYFVTPCTAPPTAGTVTLSDTGVCSGISYNVGLLGSSYGTGMTYQWQSSPDNTTWTDITGATSTTYNGSQTADTYYRCILTCLGQSDTTAALLQPMNPFYDCYCASAPTSTTYGYIGDFNFANIANVSPIGCQSYTDNTAITGVAFLGSTQALSTYINSCSSGTFNCYVKVWIDYNQDGDFNDPGEEVYGQSGQYFQTFTGTVTIPQTATVGTTGLRISMQENGSATLDPCATFTWGEVEDYTIAILPPPTNDAGVTAIDTPMSPACAVANSLYITLNNLGLDTLSTTTINWSVNGTAQSPALWSGSVAPNSNSTAPVFVGNYTFGVGDVIEVYTSNPNGVQDSISLNDTMSWTIPPLSLNGTYTIDSNGVGPTNFQSIDSAISVLSQVGVCGPVTFNIADDTYVGQQMLFGDIAGTSVTNTVTFQSASGDTAMCIVEYTSQGNGNLTYDGVVRFDQGASNIHFKNIQFYNPSTTTTYATVVSVNGDAGDLSFEGCRFVNDQQSSTSTNASLVYKNGSKATNVVFEENSFIKGSHGVYWYGSTQNYDEGLELLGNEFTDQYYRGTYIFYQDNIEIIGNVVTSSATYNFGRGFRLSNLTGDVKVKDNHIYQQAGSSWPAYGIYAFNWTGDFNAPADVSGNVISMPNGGTYGVYYSNSLFVDFANNSVLFADANASDEAIYFTNGAANKFFNNAVEVGGSALTMFVSGSAIAFSDNNAFTGNTGFTWSGSHSDLASLTAATQMDSNSAWLTAGIFADSLTLRVCNDTLDGTGIDNAYYMMDLQGDPTIMGAYDIGADQFATAMSFDAGDTVGICAGGTATLEAWYFDTIVWNSTDTGNTYQTSLPGAVTVVGMGLCGPAYDTVVVAPAPEVDLPTSSIVCSDSNGVIDAGISGASYLWSTGETTQSITVTSGGSYSVTVTSPEGCVSDDMTSASVSTPVDLDDSTPLCGSTSATIDAGISGGTYDWSTGETTQSITVTTSGIVSVTVTDADGCISSDGIDVVDVPFPTADFTSNSLQYGVEFFNGSTGAVDYLWDFGDGNTSTVENPTHIYDWTNDSAASYTVVLIASNDCGTDTVSYEVLAGSEVGFEELENGVGYSLYPVPAQTMLNLKLDNANSNTLEYQVFDVQGKVVAQRNVGEINGTFIEQINVESFAPGIYMLQMTVGQEVEAVRFVVK
jgi:hypothetical protein